MNSFKIGLVGCGRISKNHFQAIHETPGIALGAVCDTHQTRADRMAAEWDVPACYTIDELVKKDIDVVSVCTPSGLHPDHGITAARAGKHVISEKPVGTTLPQIDALIDECEKQKVYLFVVKQNRLNATMQLLKKAIDKNRFGKIYSAHVNVFWQRPQEYYDLAKWRGTWELDGGAFMNQASHYVDTIQWLMGPVKSVMAMTTTMARKIEAEDMGSAIMQFESGAVGSINVSMLTYPRNLEGSVTVLGEKGTVKVGGVAINMFEKWEFDQYDDDDKLVEESNYTPPNVYGYGHAAYYDNVSRVLHGGGQPGTDGREGRKSAELVLAIYRSSREGRKVDLPLTA